MKKVTEENNFTFLVGALILLLLVSALVEQFLHGTGQGLLDSLTVLTLTVGVWSIKSNSMWFRTGLGLIACTLLIVVAKWTLEFAGLPLLHIVTMLLFFVLTAGLAMRQVLFTGDVTPNKLTGAVCVFLLLGIIWTMLYTLAESLSPGAFNGLQHSEDELPYIEWYEHFPDLTYFSFVTLTTLGYGDITPKLPLARFLAYLQAIVGQLYIAIMVASLVGAHLAHRRERLPNDADESGRQPWR